MQCHVPQGHTEVFFGPNMVDPRYAYPIPVGFEDDSLWGPRTRELMRKRGEEEPPSSEDDTLYMVKGVMYLGAHDVEDDNGDKRKVNMYELYWQHPCNDPPVQFLGEKVYDRKDLCPMSDVTCPSMIYEREIWKENEDDIVKTLGKCKLAEARRIMCKYESCGGYRRAFFGSVMLLVAVSLGVRVVSPAQPSPTVSPSIPSPVNPSSGPR